MEDSPDSRRAGVDEADSTPARSAGDALGGGPGSSDVVDTGDVLSTERSCARAKAEARVRAVLLPCSDGAVLLPCSDGVVVVVVVVVAGNYPINSGITRHSDVKPHINTHTSLSLRAG